MSLYQPNYKSVSPIWPFKNRQYEYQIYVLYYAFWQKINNQKCDLRIQNNYRNQKKLEKQRTIPVKEVHRREDTKRRTHC
jgi:hypothetical protein